MSEIVNLRTARKRRARADDAIRADANRAAHGMTRSEREGASVETKRVERGLDGARLAGVKLDARDEPPKR